MNRAPLLMILLIAAYVRLSHPDLSWFSIDQARDVQAALGIVSGRAFPLLGPEVAGGPAHTWGPAYFYLIAIPLAVSRDPAFTVVVLSATGVASVFMTYRLGLVFFGRAVGLLAAGLVSTYPLAVIESKALWNGALLPVLTVGFFHALCSLVTHGRSVMIVPTLVTLAVLVQLHLSALSLAAVLTLALVLFRPRIRGLHLVIGLGVLLALMLPYVVAQCLSGFADLRAAPSSAKLHVRGPRELADLAFRVLFASPDVMAGLPALHATWSPGVLLALHRLEAWVLVLGLAFVGLTVVWSALRPVRNGSHPAAVLVTLGFAVPFVMLGARMDIRPHYFNVAYPLPFVAAALAMSRGIDWIGAFAGARARRALWVGLSLLVAATLVVQVDFHRQLWRTIRTMGAVIWTPGQLDLMAMRYKAELARILVNDFGADSMEIFRRVHGSRAQDLLEDKGYFFEWATASAPARVIVKPNPSLRYAVVRDEATGAALHGGRVARAGPYTVVEYQPLIDYSTWRCADDRATGARVGGDGAVDWTPIQLPTAELPRVTVYGIGAHRSWPSPIVSCRGRLSASAPRNRRLRIVVSLRAATPGSHTVVALSLNGAPIAVGRVLAYSTLAAHNVDAIFDVAEHLHFGPNDLSFQILGQTSRFDLDVYEIDG
ncbi:MAG TPA: hypothetical protein VK548_13165 [Candidatus Acidoferrum sp.]|nr:hypothetical protein [Candidatus Acidoferrum sp.]